MASMLRKVVELPRARIAGIVAGHAVLLVAILAGGLHYLVVQVLTAADLVAINAASAALYRGRSLLAHARDTLVMAVLAAFVLLFVLLTYGAAAGAEGGDVLQVAMDALATLDRSGWYWSGGLVVAHWLLALGTAVASPQPQLAWVRSAIGEGVVTLFALFVMSVVTIMLVRPCVDWLREHGVALELPTTLVVVMVALRAGIALFAAAAVTDEDMAQIARNPYAR